MLQWLRKNLKQRYQLYYPPSKIETILNEAGSVGLRSRTIESAYNILQRRGDIDRVAAYNLAFNQLLATTDEPDVRDVVVNEDEDDDTLPKNEFLYEKFADLEDEDGELKETPNE